MSRSVKDLRELINISRLSFYGDESDDKVCKSDEQGEMVGRNWSLNHEENLYSCLKSPSDIGQRKGSLRNNHFKLLPAINSSSTTENNVKPKKTLETTISEIEVARKKSCNCIVEHIDSTVVTSWLHRSNTSVQWLSKWVSTNEFFVRFAKFWLSEMDRQKQKDLIEMEVGIILDELKFSVQDGLKCKKVLQEDVMSFFLSIVWEYPTKFFGEQSKFFILNTLLVLASGRKEKYRKLLSNVKFATKNSEQLHWILSVRAFALISIVTSLVKFYSSLTGFSFPQEDATRQCLKSVQDFTFDAVKLGYLDILVYLVEMQGIDVSGLKNTEDNSLLFCAVTSSQVEVVDYILKIDQDVNVKQISKSGNGLLHAAVNTGDSRVVRLLLNAGLDVNQINTECGGATPLHLAVMQDSSEIVQILLSAGAETNLGNECDSPLQLAEELENIVIFEMMKKRDLSED